MKDTMDLAIKCRKCGNWSATSTQNLSKAMFNCKSCSHKGKIRNWRNEWNYTFIQIPMNVNVAEFMQNLKKVSAN
jgi:late competence protein required for DNA uptake (superfamily II DNA/RNA helicase)